MKFDTVNEYSPSVKKPKGAPIGPMNVRWSRSATNLCLVASTDRMKHNEYNEIIRSSGIIMGDDEDEDRFQWNAEDPIIFKSDL